jgi:hypothetical protein
MNKFELVVESSLLDWKVFGYTVCGLVSGLVVLVFVG